MNKDEARELISPYFRADEIDNALLVLESGEQWAITAARQAIADDFLPYNYRLMAARLLSLLTKEEQLGESLRKS